jgi:hypothetical protein
MSAQFIGDCAALCCDHLANHLLETDAAYLCFGSFDSFEHLGVGVQLIARELQLTLRGLPFLKTADARIKLGGKHLLNRVTGAARKSRLLTASICVASLVAALQAPATSGNATPSASPATRTPPPSAPQVCDISDLQPLLARGGYLHDYPEQAWKLMDHRLAGCRSMMQAYRSSLPTESPSPSSSGSSSSPQTKKDANLGDYYDLPTPKPSEKPTPPTSECTLPSQPKPFSTADAVHAYDVLSICSQWVARYIPSAAPAESPSANPTPPGLHLAPTFAPASGPQSPELEQKVVYVLALASDAPTSAQIALQLASDLQSMYPTQKQVPRVSYDHKRVVYVPIPEPTWTLAQYQQQCFSDSTTAGAIVVLQTGTETRSWDVVVGTGSRIRVRLGAVVLDCEPTNAAYTNNAAYVTWISPVVAQSSGGFLGGFTGFPLNSLVAVAAGILAFQPSRTENFTYATAPPQPGSTTAYETGYSTTSNSGIGLVAGTTAAALAPVQSTTLGVSPGTDQLTADSVKNDLLYGLIPAMHDYCYNRADRSDPVEVPPLTPTPSPTSSLLPGARSTLTPTPTPTPTPISAQKPSPPPMTQCAWFGPWN